MPVKTAETTPPAMRNTTPDPPEQRPVEQHADKPCSAERHAVGQHTDEEPSVERLIERYRLPLRAFIRRRIPDPEDAEDLLQEVFYRLTRTLEENSRQIEQVSAWLFRVARNAISNFGRKRREERLPDRSFDDGEGLPAEIAETLFDDDNPTPDTAYLRSLVWEELADALAELPAEQREIFELTEFEGLPIREIARTMQIPVNTLLSRKHYAVLHLRRRLRSLYLELLQA